MNRKNAYLLVRVARELDDHVAKLREEHKAVTPAMDGYMFGLEAAAGVLRAHAERMKVHHAG